MRSKRRTFSDALSNAVGRIIISLSRGRSPLKIFYGNFLDVLAKLAPMYRVAHEIYRAVAKLPRTVKFIVGAAILIEFIVITNWEKLSFTEVSPSSAPPLAVAPRSTEPSRIEPQQKLATADSAPPTTAVPVVATLSKRMERFVITEPNVQSDGAISGNGWTFHLYGIKQFDSKALCTKASGDRWACGLHAYATLRNTIAKGTITCDPKTATGNTVTASCRMGAVDIALMLVQEGLVEADDTSDPVLAKAQAFAKLKKIGIWDR